MDARPSLLSKVDAYRPNVRVWVFASQCSGLWSSLAVVSPLANPSVNLFLRGCALAFTGHRAKLAAAEAIPMILWTVSWFMYSMTFRNAIGGSYVSSQPWLIVHRSLTPSRDNPSAGLESESIHSYHAVHECSSMAICVHAAMWPTSSALDVPRINEPRAAPLSMNHTSSRLLSDPGAKYESRQNRNRLRRKDMCFAGKQRGDELPP